MKTSSFALLFLLVTPLMLMGEKLPDRFWPAWRGIDSSGTISTGNYPADFDNEKNVVWKYKLPGIGCSTPIVYGNSIYVTCPIEEQDGLLCFNWQGKIQWQKTVGNQRKGKHRNGSGSNPSPVTDGKFLVTYFKSGNLAGFDLDGKQLWSTNLQERFGKDSLYWDLGTSPVLTKKNVIVAVMHHGNSFLAAFDKQTGKLAWEVERNYVTPTEGDHSYATPHVIQHQGKETIVVWGAERLTAHDAANGEITWICRGFNPDENKNWVAVASSVLSGEMAIVPYGRGAHLTGVKMSGSGDITKTNRVWTRDDTGSFVPTPAVSGNQIFVLKDKGEVECLNAQTGETIFTGEFPKNRNKYYSSPTIAGSHLYAAREDGSLMVADISNGFKFLTENVMQERLVASPVPINGQLLIRGEEHLYLIGEK
ncbi:MAG: outer membrane protein assembly factor BamB family protein [Pirellulales bacterium]